ncbi:(Fe-S)-binding protein [Candidatus Woesearchaeota archaeon]|nr:(Fe-S)-binding protein [Candidatus Woesearchaeota archaeon]
MLTKAVGAVKRGRVLYYPGCLTQGCLPKAFQNYKSLLHDAGIDYFMIPELSCCGSPLLGAGYKEAFEEQKNLNMRLLKKHGVSKIVSNCPHCVRVFKDLYGVETEHISKTLDSSGFKPTRDHGEFSYHDPCLLAKSGVIAEPRSLLKKRGFTIKEPFHCKERTFCCGAGGGLKQNNPELASKIASARIKQLRAAGIVTSCPYCYLHLKENLNPSIGKHVFEMSEVLFDE